MIYRHTGIIMARVRDDRHLANVLRRLLDEGCWTSYEHLARGHVGVDGSVHDLSPDEQAAIRRYWRGDES